MTDLVTNLAIAEIAVVTVAGGLSARLIKLGRNQDRVDHPDYLAPMRGLVAGTAWGAVIWTAGLGVCVVVASG